jgi:hypothetical protein
MIRHKLVFVVAVAATGAVVAAPKENPLIPIVKSALVRALKDPESARFRDVYIKWDTVCGHFNAKNSNGGYVGFRRFYAIDGEVLRMENGEDFDDRAWDNYCGPKAPKPQKPQPFHEKSWDDTK